MAYTVKESEPSNYTYINSELLGYTDRHHSPARQRQGSRAIEVILPVKSLFAFAQNRLSTSAWTPYN